MDVRQHALHARHIKTNRKKRNSQKYMKKEIAEKILYKQVESEFHVVIMPRPRRWKHHPDYVKRTRRDASGDMVNEKGELILPRVKTDSGKTMTPSQQFKMSAFSKQGQMLRRLRKERQLGSEIGLDKKFEKDMQ